MLELFMRNNYINLSIKYFSLPASITIFYFGKNAWLKKNLKNNKIKNNNINNNNIKNNKIKE